jgi:hypothetical protein
MMTNWEKFERVLLLIAVLILLTDLFYWRPY